MGCGQSKINLYPRKNKNGKGNSAKKSGATDKEADEEEGSAGTQADETEEEEPRKHILPLVSHQPIVEVSASQQDFFKLLDDKIDKGKDYDSTSETEVKIEQERRMCLIDQWRQASRSSSQSQPSPPTPARRRMPRPLPPERHGSPGAGRRCGPSYRSQHIAEGLSPPPRRSNSAQSHHPDQRHINGDNWHDPTKSPVKRPQSAGANWKNNPKVAPYPKPKRESDRPDMTGSGQDMSQITFNPTFQTHSPAHSAKQQPYIAQILSYPMSQQVTPPSPPKYIAPPEEYQDPQNNIVDPKQTQRQPPQGNAQSIYYIHGNTTTNINPDLAQQRQQTAIHLQQYVAMKQAQQQMFTFIQRGPHTVFPNVEYANQPRMYENEEYVQYSHPIMRPLSAPGGRQIPVAPGYSDGAHMVQMPMWTQVPPPHMGPWVPGQVPDMQYYPQSQFMPMYRPHSAGSAGTLTRYKKEGEEKMCQSINLVRQKPIGQIVSLPGQELTVCNNVSDSPSPASVSTDSGVSPGNSAPSSKNSVFSENSTVENKPKKNKPQSARSLKNSKSLDS